MNENGHNEQDPEITIEMDPDDVVDAVTAIRRIYEGNPPIVVEALCSRLEEATK
jgi:hypothetical protein